MLEFFLIILIVVTAPAWLTALGGLIFICLAVGGPIALLVWAYETNGWEGVAVTILLFFIVTGVVRKDTRVTH